MTDLRTQAAVGVAWTALQKWLIRLTGLATFVVLSRLLSPREIGLAALALAVIAVTSALGNLGAAPFLVQTDDYDEETRNATFWTTAAVSLVLSGGVFLLAEPLSEALGTPALAPLVQALAPVVFLNGISAVPTGDLLRTLRFRALAVRETAATGCAGVAGVSLAFAGAGVWSLIAQAAVHSVVSSVLIWKMTAWRPGRKVSKKALRALRRFGLPLLAVNIMQSVRDRIEQFLLGSLVGLEALGIWTIATRLLGVLSDVSIAVLDVVALPVLKRASADAARFARALAVASASAQLLIAPALLLLAVGGPAIVPFVFGDRWAPAVLPAQIMCLSYAVAGLAYFTRPALLSRGRTRADFAITASSLTVHVIMVVLVAPLGLVALAWGIAAETVVLVAASAVVVNKTLDVRYGAFFDALKVFLCAIASAVVGLGLSAALPGVPAVVAASLSIVLFALLAWVTSAPAVREAAADVRRIVR